MKKALIIFVRKMELGKVKTRLAATLGDQQALAIYKELVEHTFSMAQNAVADKFVFYHQAIEEDDCWNAPGFFKLLQHQGSLGEKMNAAFQNVFEWGYEQVLIIGSDCLQLSPTIIESAFEALDTTEVVIGPANDGGYYLLGMKQLHSFLFDNKQWSTNSVFADTMKDIETLGLTSFILKQLIDVDTEEDWLLSKTTQHV